MTRRSEIVPRKRGPSPAGVEPLSQRAWGRVEAGLFERIDQGALLAPDTPAKRGLPSAALWIGAGALAVAASVLLWWRFEAATPETTPPAVAASAPVERTRIVTTGAPTQTTLGEAELTLAASSALSFSGSDSAGWWLQLEQGQVDCHVAPRRGRPAFVLQAGRARVSVVGTRFSVSRQGDAVSVRVSEGQVRVSEGAVEWMLGPGEQWPAPPRVEPNRDRRARPALAREPKSEPKRSAGVGRRSGARERFERAARLEVSDPEAAIALYAELARSGGAWSANALYAQARMQLEHGRVTIARRLLRRYVERHPHGLNIDDVRALLRRVDTGRD